MNDATLIAEAKKCLDGTHIDLSKYKATINRKYAFPIVYFTASSGCKIVVTESYRAGHCEGDTIFLASFNMMNRRK